MLQRKSVLETKAKLKAKPKGKLVSISQHPEVSNGIVKDPIFINKMGTGGFIEEAIASVPMYVDRKDDNFRNFLNNLGTDKIKIASFILSEEDEMLYIRFSSSIAVAHSLRSRIIADTPKAAEFRKVFLATPPRRSSWYRD